MSCNVYLTFLYTRSADLSNSDFEFILVCPEKLTTPSRVRDQNSSDFSQSNCFDSCLLFPSSFVALLLNYPGQSYNLHFEVHLSKRVHVLLRLDFRVKITYFVHECFTLHVAELRRAHCSVQIVPN